MDDSRWGICLGPWGDIICALGHYQSLLGSGNMVYVGYMPGAEEFLAAQDFIDRVAIVRPADREEYRECVRMMWSKDAGVRRQGILRVLEGSAINADQVVDTNLNYGFSGYAPEEIPIARGLKLPRECEAWAGDVIRHLPRPVYVLHPYSVNTNRLEAHWPHWVDYMNWLAHDQSKHYLTCGVNWSDASFAKLSNVTRLVGKTPTVMHLFALADRADAVITTSNSVAHYCAANERRAVVLSVERNSEPTEYFKHVLRGPNMRVFNKFSTFWRVCLETKEFLGIWPEITSGTN